MIFSEQDAVIKIARKIQNEKNLMKLQESKKEAIKIIRNNLKDQSLTLQERLKQRKIQRLTKNFS